MLRANLSTRPFYNERLVHIVLAVIAGLVLGVTVLNVVQVIKLSTANTSLSARMRYGSNFPIQGYIAEDSTGYLLSAQRNGLRLPAYSRLDLRADRTFTYRKSRLTLFIEVVNATNRDNYRANSPGINVSTRRVFGPIDPLFPLLPVAGVLVEF